MDISSINSTLMTDLNDQLSETQDQLAQIIQQQENTAAVQSTQNDAFSTSTIQPCN